MYVVNLVIFMLGSLPVRHVRSYTSEPKEELMDRLKNKVILISGGARGQGVAEARLCITEGARVVIGDVLEAEGRQLAGELGGSARYVHQDVTQEGDWD